MKQHIAAYYRLAKPGIVYGNAIAAAAGYFYGANGQVDWSVFAAMIAGISLVIASACAYNNVLDRNIDARMHRTRGRAVPTGTISIPAALIYATTLLIIGVGLLWLLTNPLTLSMALIGHFAYVVIYGWAKRTTVHSTLIGTISGSTPPVIGYVAAVNQLDVTAGLLFSILVAWQMPHFYAIAIFRRDDYQAAGVPVLSVVQGMAAAKRQIIIYVALFLLTCVALWSFTGASLMWLLVMGLVGLYWLYLCLLPKHSETIVSWSRKQFGFSLSVLLILCLMLSLDFIFI